MPPGLYRRRLSRRGCLRRDRRAVQGYRGAVRGL